MQQSLFIFGVQNYHFNHLVVDKIFDFEIIKI
jgi:hypothetical protein